MKIPILALLLSSLPAFAQVTITANMPAYNFQVLPGSTRQINVNITGGTANTVNWSVLSTTGSSSATFTDPTHAAVSSISGALPTMQVNIGSAAGSCSIPQASTAIGTYTVVSTATVTVQAQSVDDTSKTATFLFNVCANTTTVITAPAYRQAYGGQHVSIQSWVIGNVDETGTWSILSQPAGGNGALADTGKRDADFVATVTGRYTLKYTSAADATKNSTSIVYVSPNPLPTYASTPNTTEPRECAVDPAFTGAVYDVGVGKAFTTMQSVPAANTWTAGTIMRVWNTDTTGISPSTFHEYFQIHNSGTATQPIVLCGVADAQGNLPVVDGANSTGQAGVSTGAAAGWGIISVWGGGYGGGTPFGYWQSGSAGPSYVTVSGLHIMHGTPAYNYTPPGGGSPVAWGSTGAGGGVSCLNVRGGSYVDLGGNDLDTCGNGIITTENSNSAWADITQYISVTGNHMQHSGNVGSSTEHQMYLQSFYAVASGNRLDNYTSGALGSNIKWRGVEGIFRYNYLESGPSRMIDMVENQDASPYVTFEQYLSVAGQTNCNFSVFCTGDTAGANVIAAFQESLQKDFVYGNLIFGTSSQYQIHYASDHDGAMANHNGTLYFYSNTLDNAQVVFDTRNQNIAIDYQTSRIDARNNLLWTLGTQTEFGRDADIILSSTTNLMNAGTFLIATPISGGAYNAGTSNGWEATCSNGCPWLLTVPIDKHLYALSNANYLTTSTLPYSRTTGSPPTGSAAISAGTALTGLPAQSPVRYQWQVSTNSVVPRLNVLTIGAVDSGSAPPPTGPSVAIHGHSKVSGKVKFH